jgi:tight adherence protein C
MTSTAEIVLVGVFLIVAGAPFVSIDWFRDTRTDERIRSVVFRHSPNRELTPRRDAQSQTVRFIRQLGALASNNRLVGAANLTKIREAVRSAGFIDSSAYTILIGAKIVGAIGLPIAFILASLALSLSPIFTIMSGVVGFIVGLLGPEWWLSVMRARYETKIKHALPDTLDLLVICVDAGLGLESALNRVAAEIRESYPTLSLEIRSTCHDLQVNPDVGAVLRGLAGRVKVEGISRLVTTLLQSILYGSPLSRSLHILSREMRQDALAAFEEQATKLPTKMTVPMIVFILPALMTIIMGPAIHGVLIALSHMGK